MREVLVAAGLQGLRCRLFPAPSVRWLKAGNSPSAQTARLFTLHLLQSLYRKQSEACPCSPSALCDPPGLLSFFKLFYCRCSFVALGGKMPPSAFFIGGVLRAGGRGGCGIAGSALPSVSGAFGALAKSRELAFGSDSPAFYAALASVALSETVGGLPLQFPRLVRPPGLLSFFKLVYCHCSFVALGGKMPPSAFFIGGVLKAGGRGGCGIAGFVLPSVSGAFGALAKSRELAFGSDSPAFYAALASVALSETVGGLPLQFPRLVRPPGLLSFFKLVYCHCSFVALGGKMPPSAFFIGGVLKAGGRGGCGIAGFVLPSVSVALRDALPSWELAFGSDSPAFYAALASVALSETIGGLPLQSPRLVRPPGLLSFFRLVYCHCSFVALGGKMPPSAFFIGGVLKAGGRGGCGIAGDRKSTRLNSSHVRISY